MSTTTIRTIAQLPWRAKPGPWCGTETLQGKGHVVRRMFADVEADVYVLVDGDDTYDAASAPEMVSLLIDQQLDMVNGARVTEIDAAYRRGHRFGNVMLASLVRWVFGDRYPTCSPATVCSPPLREVFPRPSLRLRDGNRVHRPCARTEDAGRRGAYCATRTGPPAPLPSCAPIPMACAFCAPSSCW